MEAIRSTERYPPSGGGHRSRRATAMTKDRYGTTVNRRDLVACKRDRLLAAFAVDRVPRPAPILLLVHQVHRKDVVAAYRAQEGREADIGQHTTPRQPCVHFHSSSNLLTRRTHVGFAWTLPIFRASAAACARGPATASAIACPILPSHSAWRCALMAMCTRKHRTSAPRSPTTARSGCLGIGRPGGARSRCR